MSESFLCETQPCPESCQTKTLAIISSLLKYTLMPNHIPQ